MSKPKILTVIGARPQFIKAAPVSKALREVADEILVHTGQHYDEKMSHIFFDEMGIPAPDYNLGVGSGSHGKQTGLMLAELEAVMLKEKPDYVVIYGDTNSTLAAAIAAVKLHIPVGHIEAGLRSYNRHMPEEINRILSDDISAQLFCPTQTAIDCLEKEHVAGEVLLTGDVMLDAVRHFEPLSCIRSSVMDDLGLKYNGYYLFTMHRPENTDFKERVINIFKGLEACDKPVIYPLHPRMKHIIEQDGIRQAVAAVKNLRIVEPVGYLDMLRLESNACKIITDSGGMQKESFFFKKPCINIRDESEWVETVKAGYNLIVGADTEKIRKAINSFNPQHETEQYFGDGHAAKHIVDAIIKFCS